MLIKLTKLVQIPDETYIGDGQVPTATNYPGAVLEVSGALGDKLIESGDAVEHALSAPEESPTAGGETA